MKPTAKITTTTKPNEEAIASAIRDAMEQYRDTGKINFHNPAILADTDGSVFCGSAIGMPEESILWDLQEGLGSWTPEPGDDLAALARGAADAVVADINASRK